MSRPLRLLIIEDSEDDAVLLTRHLSRGGHDVVHERVETGAALREALATDSWDAILADFSLPRFNVHDALAIIKEADLDLPVIVVSGVVTAHQAVDLMRAGAHDFLEKDDLVRLAPALERELREARIRARHRLAAREIAKLSLAVEQSPNSVIITDAQGCIEYVNEFFTRVSGISREEALGRNPNIIASGNTGRDIYEDMWRTISAGRIWRGEMMNRTKTGERYWDHLSISPITDSSGQITHYLGIQTNITEHKSTLEALRTSEERLALALEGANDGLWDWNVSSGECYFSPRWETMLGYEPGTIHPHLSAWKALVDPRDDLDLEALANRGSAAEARTFEHEYRLRKADGEWLWVLLRGKVLDWSPDGAPLRAVGTHSDISERMQIQERLRQAARVFESTNEGVLIAGPDRKIVAVNNAFTTITGYGADEVIGQDPGMLKSERHPPAFYQAMWASISTTGQWQGEIWNRRKHGEVYPQWENISTIKDDDGEVLNYVSVFSDISAIKQSQERLEHLAHHDPLTGLPNRLLFNARLEHALLRADREKHLAAILFLDLDRFKDINDALGHPVGDGLLCAVARHFSESVRGEDTVARLGGDEFTVILEDLADAGSAAGVAQKLQDSIAVPFDIDGQEVFITTSIGISLFPDDGTDVTTLVKNADTAMYRAKERGRSTFQFYAEELTTSARKRFDTENRLRRALGENELAVYYQPQFSLSHGGIIGAEALVRWMDPQRGVIDACEFIDVAEESRLIEEIDTWVLRTACKAARRWQETGSDPIPVAVNLSGFEFERGTLVPDVRAALEESGLDPHLLELEVTESRLMQQTNQSTQTLSQLKSLGVSLAVDDFGTGYSSLASLRQLPVDKLKIDQSFVRSIPGNVDDTVITNAITTLGHNLRLTVIAEGVETEAQADALRACQCDGVQGFLRSRPLPADKFEELLRSSPGSGAARDPN